MIVGIVSGYFNPLHQGHIEYINAAKYNCDELIAIINNDKQVKLKGSQPFMDERHRAFIVANLKFVNRTFISVDTDQTVCESLRRLRWEYPDDFLRFFNSGDRVENAESKELQLCNDLGMEYMTLPLPKKFSSSELKDKLNKVL